MTDQEIKNNKSNKTKELEAQIAAIEIEMSSPMFWENKDNAQERIQEHQNLKDELERGDAGPYDSKNAIVTIFSGAGGDDAEDFSRILFEMYSKYIIRKKWKAVLVHSHPNDHGGFRNISFKVVGKNTYGSLKKESGVHRLVRISPFNAKQLRHTSFSLVEVIPEFEKPTDFEIPEDELDISFTRSGGPGGQNVNKRETAVRIVHTPTGIAVHTDTERSQADNKSQALALIKGKLFKALEEERIKKEEGMYISKTTEAEWGNQIRSYVTHPYKMVKDHRTNVETSQVEKVFNGELDEFIEAEKNL